VRTDTYLSLVQIKFLWPGMLLAIPCVPLVEHSRLFLIPVSIGFTMMFTACILSYNRIKAELHKAEQKAANDEAPRVEGGLIAGKRVNLKDLPKEQRRLLGMDPKTKYNPKEKTPHAIVRKVHELCMRMGINTIIGYEIDDMETVDGVLENLNIVIHWLEEGTYELRKKEGRERREREQGKGEAGD
jgi:hypothetical protein